MDVIQNSEKFYLESGQIEPLYTSEEERKLLIEGMEMSIQKIQLEVVKAIKNTKQITDVPCERLVARMKEVETLQQKFGAFLTERSFIF